MAENAGFKIGETEYEFPQRFRMGDPVLVEELTGIPFDKFSERLEVTSEGSDGEPKADMVVMVGLIGVAIWQAHPRWKRERVVEFVNDLDMEQFTAVAGDAVPPTPGPEGPASHSGGSSNESTSIQEHSEDRDLG